VPWSLRVAIGVMHQAAEHLETARADIALVRPVPQGDLAPDLVQQPLIPNPPIDLVVWLPVGRDVPVGRVDGLVRRTSLSGCST